MKLNKCFLCLTVLVLLTFLAAFQSSPNLINITQTDLSDNTVNIFFEDQSGLIDFTASNLFLNDQALKDVQADPLNSTDTPIATLFLVDVSKDYLIGENARPQELINLFAANTSMNRNGRNNIFILPFGDKVGPVFENRDTKKLEFTSDTADYYLALKESLDFFAKRTPNSSPEKQQIILVTDGLKHDDTNISLTQLKTRLKQAGLQLFCVVTYTPDGIVDADSLKQLSDLSALTNGTALSLKDNSHIDVLGNTLISRIMNSYLIRGELPELINTEASDKYELQFELINDAAVVADKQFEAEMPGLHAIASERISKATSIAEEERANAAATATTLANIEATANADATAAANAEATILAADQAAAATAEAEINAKEANQVATAAAEAVKKADALATEQAVITATAEAYYAINGCYAPGEDSCASEFSLFLNREQDILGLQVKNLYWCLGLAILLLILGMIIILRSGKAEEPAAENEQTEPIDKDRPSAQISLENAAENSSDAPIRETLYEGEEKVFGRKTAQGICGLNGDVSISKVHFMLLYTAGVVYIEDMASSNGVILNGSRLQMRARLNDNDLLLIGKTTFRVHISLTDENIDPDGKTELFY